MDSFPQTEEQLERTKNTLVFMCQEENDPESCHKLGYLYEVAERDFFKAKEIYENNCLKNTNKDSCHKMGTYMFMNRGGYENRRMEALELLSKNCMQRKCWKSCHAAGLAYLSTDILKTKNDHYSPQKALEHFELGCENGGSDSCDVAGDLLYKGTRVEQNMTKALKYFTIGCDLASLKCCNNGAWIAKRGFKEVESNPTLYKEFKEKFDFINKSNNPT